MYTSGERSHGSHSSALRSSPTSGSLLRSVLRRRHDCTCLVPTGMRRFGPFSSLSSSINLCTSGAEQCHTSVRPYVALPLSGTCSSLIFRFLIMPRNCASRYPTSIRDTSIRMSHTMRHFPLFLTGVTYRIS